MDSWLIKQSKTDQDDADILGASISTVDGSSAGKNKVRKCKMTS
jgi:predicted regulator of Ras-like GTPase activity (Roadblock/LC7/MglB family)